MSQSPWGPDNLPQPPPDYVFREAGQLAMFDVDPAIIDTQIQAGLIAYQGSAFGFLNNFFNKLPDSSGEKLTETAGMMDVPMGHASARMDDSQQALHTNRFMEITHRDFFDDIYDAVNQSAVNWVQLGRLQRLCQESSGEEGASLLESLCEFIIPVYKQLRMMGYSHYDLWC